MRFIRLISVLVTAIFFAAAVPTANAAETKPNLIIIFADDLGYADLSSFGSESIKTPNLDRLAAEGAKLTQFYVPFPVCSPSRAALLTGRSPARTGILYNVGPKSAEGFPDSEITLAEIMKQNGYATGMVGKWHLGYQEQFLPPNHGFDFYYGLPYSNDMMTKDKPVPLIKGTQIIEQPVRQDTLTRRYTEQATDFIREHKDGPFFLYLPHTFPHVPLYASEQFRGNSAGGLYGDVVEELDWSVGEVAKTVADLGIDKNTFIFFTSDNGPWLVKKEDAGSAGKFREGKATCYEGGIRVPGIAYWPGKISPKVIDEPAITLDLYPTLVKLAGGQLPGDRKYDGEDIMPLLTGTGKRKGDTFFHYAGRRSLYAVRSGKWKLMIPWTDRDGTEHPAELYDIEADPSEKNDQSKQQPEVVERLLAMGKAFDEEARANAPGYTKLPPGQDDEQTTRGKHRDR